MPALHLLTAVVRVRVVARAFVQTAAQRQASKEAELQSRQASLGATQSELEQQREELQAKQQQLQELQASLAADAAALSNQLSAFERSREDAVKELQVRPGQAPCVPVMAGACEQLTRPAAPPLHLPAAPACHQVREEQLVACENTLAAAQEAAVAQQGAAQVEVSRLEACVRELHKQLGEAEADYLTGSERLAQLHREVSARTQTRSTGAWRVVACRDSQRAHGRCAWHWSSRLRCVCAGHAAPDERRQRGG